MKKDEVFEIAWHMYNSVDQADHDMTVKEVLQTATVDGLKKFIESLLSDEGSPEWNPDLEILEKAKRLVKWNN